MPQYVCMISSTMLAVVTILSKYLMLLVTLGHLAVEASRIAIPSTMPAVYQCRHLSNLLPWYSVEEEVSPEAVAHVSVDQVEFGKGGFQAAHLPLGSLDATI